MAEIPDNKSSLEDIVEESAVGDRARGECLAINGGVLRCETFSGVENPAVVWTKLTASRDAFMAIILWDDRRWWSMG